MLNVGAIEEGFVLDHIKAGKSMTIYHDLKLDKLDCCVAIIKNARSNKMGKKDIIKVECPVDMMNLDTLGFIDHNITVNVISKGEIIEKKVLKLPKKIVNVIRCRNPRCITSIEQTGLRGTCADLSEFSYPLKRRQILPFRDSSRPSVLPSTELLR